MIASLLLVNGVAFSSFHGWHPFRVYNQIMPRDQRTGMIQNLVICVKKVTK